MSEYNTINVTGLSGCTRGQMVAFVGDHYVPAAAGWEYLPEDGSLRPSQSSYVYGVLISSVDASGGGTLLLSGVITDSSIIAALCGTTPPAAGPYYLSTNGKAVLGVPAGMLPVFCGYYSGYGFKFSPTAPEYAGHRHTNYPLSANLFNSNGVYDSAGSDTTFTQMMAGLPPEAVVVLSSGALLTSNDYTISSDNKLTIPAAVANSSGYAVCGINPLIGTNPEVRAVAPAAGNHTTVVSKLYGTVYLDNTYPELTTTPLTSGGVCISDISREGVTKSTVVNQITGAGGIQVTSSNGIYEVSDTPVGTYLDFQTINANNVLIGATAGDATLTFPEGVNASILGIVRLPARTSGTWSFRVFTWPSTTLTTSVTVITPPATFGDAPTVAPTVSGTANDTIFTGSGGALIQATLAGTGVRLDAAGIYLDSSSI